MLRLNFILVAILLISASGCGGAQKPSPRVTTAVGTSSKCENCGKEVATVAEEQYVVIGPSRFVVCDAECHKKLAHKMEAQ